MDQLYILVCVFNINKCKCWDILKHLITSEGIIFLGKQLSKVAVVFQLAFKLNHYLFDEFARIARVTIVQI